MQDRTVSWPTQGDRATFRRRLALSTAAGAAVVVALTAGPAVVLQPSMLGAVLPLTVGGLLLLVLWTHGTARTAARRTEMERSFAGLVVVHHGEAFEVAKQPMLGEYTSRRHAAHAALDRGGWAVIVQAWDRFYVLAAQPTGDAAERRAPVSFRSRAVADVVPAIRDDIALGA